MTSLLYCVFRRPRRRKLEGPLRGVDGRPVRRVAHGELCAATSPVAEAPLAPTLPRIQAYERVVEALFSKRTVVPMRFGSTLESERHVARYLKEHSALFRERLRELSGCVEMGIRVTVPAPSTAVAPKRERPSGARAEPGSGREYLEARARRGRPVRASGAPLGELVARYRSAFEGLFTKVQVEPPASLR
ncbi:MAG: GvpL/GvpF family gas vesicle protein, partial [Deltaproteobacteria bacterium]|nr:GvpL/GvpF family gas vesicle protein [Deltaproteobacteria bacterium]